ncbi:MAG: MBL fold metallo-hydrolase [Streptococcaceae bacterium]|jgi:glyoxylase-like metal-dependent hydrolase (beta-lactamase superfamily II)|nr:MBL fold metallo-hydrolase [Streptococcaceae bacterium]
MLDIIKLTNKVALANTYFISNAESLIIIDPGSDTEQILKTIEQLDKKVCAILLTHTHYDHIMSVEAIRAAYPEVLVYVSPLEAKWLFTPELNLSGLARHDDMPDVIVQKADFGFNDHHLYTIGGMSFKVLPTPGHSIGGVSFLFDDFVVTGDALFKGSIGRTDLPTGNHSQLIVSIKAELLILPEDMPVLPGHGENTNIRDEKWYNPYLN